MAYFDLSTNSQALIRRVHAAVSEEPVTDAFIDRIVEAAFTGFSVRQ